jgi:DNA-binding transcriptional MocR family regulator
LRERLPQQMRTDEFLARLGHWYGRTSTLSGDLAEAVMSAVKRGDLRSHTVLPPQREVARALAVSRSTVVQAFEMLARQGWLESRQGSGTWVRDPAAGPEQPDWMSFLGAMPIFRHRDEAERPVVDLATAGVAADELCRSILAVATDRLGDVPTHGYLPAGLPVLRGALAAHLSARGLPTTSEQILVTEGAQQGIYLSMAALLDGRSTVLVEEAMYAGSLEVLRLIGARSIPVPTDGHGPRPEALTALAAQHRPELAVLTPTCANPTGVSLSQIRKTELAVAAGQAGLLVLEDAAQNDLVFDGTPATYLAQHGRDDQVMVVGSLSKLLWGGLRIGWVRAPEPVIRNLSRFKAAVDLGTSVLSQLAAVEALARYHELRAARVAWLAAMRDIALQQLAAMLPEWQPTSGTGGMALWIRLPGTDAVAFAEAARQVGVSVTPGSTFTVTEQFSDMIRLSYATSPDALREGIARLSEAWSLVRQPR